MRFLRLRLSLFFRGNYDFLPSDNRLSTSDRNLFFYFIMIRVRFLGMTFPIFSRVRLLKGFFMVPRRFASYISMFPLRLTSRFRSILSFIRTPFVMKRLLSLQRSIAYTFLRLMVHYQSQKYSYLMSQVSILRFFRHHRTRASFISTILFAILR